MRFLSISDARKGLTELVGRSESTIITRRGEPASVLLNYDLFRTLTFELGLLKSSERDRILSQHSAVQEGQLGEFEDLELDLEAEG